MNVVTRFPPSPTGFMHIGNARTALFNYLYARHHGGKFVMRIEDTDRKRHNEAAVDAIMEGMKWLELEYDGEVTSQFSRLDHHAKIAHQLLAEGKAYKCYCSPEELEDMRESAKASGAKTFYDRRWRDRDESEAPADVEPVVRIKAPLEGATTIHDLVQGDVTVNNDQLDDFIILRSDGTPTYMLSVVVDDHDMEITHVIRGDDHLNNTFRQKIIFDAMGWDVPEFAHLPLILGPDGAKMSKRHGAASVEEYRDMGYLPEALCNYLLRLGWSHGDDEIISREQALAWFDLDHVGKSASRFDFAKLENLNAHYIKEADTERLLSMSAPFFEMDVSEKARGWIAAHIDELKDKSKTLIDFAREAAFYAKTLPLDYDDKAKELIADKEALKLLLEGLEALNEFTADNIKSLCKEIADQHFEGKMGKTGMPLRAAITGRGSSVTIFDACAIMGQDETLARLRAAIDFS